MRVIHSRRGELYQIRIGLLTDTDVGYFTDFDKYDEDAMRKIRWKLFQGVDPMVARGHRPPAGSK